MTLEFITLFFNISGGEIFIILLVVFIVFGPAKIPEIARSLGRMMNEVKKASSDITREFRKETTTIEREFRKTADEITKDFEPLTGTTPKDSNKRNIITEAHEIPDVYMAGKPMESEQGNHSGAEQEKTEKPIQ